MSCVQAWVDLYPDQDEFYVCLTDFTAENMNFGDYQEYKIDLRQGPPPPFETKPRVAAVPSNTGLNSTSSAVPGTKKFPEVIAPLQLHRELLMNILQNNSSLEACILWTDEQTPWT